MTTWILTAGLLLAGTAANVHPYVQTVERFRAARKSHDTQTLRAVLSEDSRIWFDEKKGEGSPRNLEGGGPWSQWDAFFHSESTLLDTHVEGRSLRTTVSEINDWYRLVERPASTYYITYYFDEQGRIEGTLIHSMGEEPTGPRDRLDEFEAWARAHEPGLLEKLLPDDEIDPTQAPLWKEKLLQWRADAGLGNPLDDSQ